MKNIIALFCIAFLILGFSSCQNGVTFEDNSKPGRRDYVWTIIDSTGNDIEIAKIWGDSPDNIWISGGFAVNETERLWHYDGIKLKAAGVHGLYPNCVFGFGSNNVYSTSNREIWHNDGTNWHIDYTLSMTGYNSYYGISLYDINGGEPGNLWAVGTVYGETGTIEDGIIYQNKGKGWLKRYKTTFKNTSFSKSFPGYSENQCFIWGVKRKYNPWVDSSAVWEYDGMHLKQIHLGVMRDLENGCAINKINGIIYITIGNTIHRYYNGKLYEFLTVTHPDFIFAVYGRNEKDLFLWGREGLLHYNGTDVQYVYNPGWPIFIIEKVLSFENSVFICAQNTSNGKYYFIKGELPDK